MCRRYARGKNGDRVRMPKPFNKGIKFSIISAISSKKVISALYGEWSTDGIIFEEFIKQHLVPHLTRRHVVILDKARFHKMKCVKELIESRGAKLIYLPGYSPELSPVENMWSKVKDFICKKAPRNEREFHRAIRAAFLSISENDLAGWYKHCGYTVQPLRKLL